LPQGYASRLDRTDRDEAELVATAAKDGMTRGNRNREAIIYPPDEKIEKVEMGDGGDSDVWPVHRDRSVPLGLCTSKVAGMFIPPAVQDLQGRSRQRYTYSWSVDTGRKIISNAMGPTPRILERMAVSKAVRVALLRMAYDNRACEYAVDRDSWFIDVTAKWWWKCRLVGFSAQGVVGVGSTKPSRANEDFRLAR